MKEYDGDFWFFRGEKCDIEENIVRRANVYMHVASGKCLAFVKRTGRHRNRGFNDVDISGAYCEIHDATSYSLHVVRARGCPIVVFSLKYGSNARISGTGKDAMMVRIFIEVLLRVISVIQQREWRVV
jgi:hypothetical protein